MSSSSINRYHTQPTFPSLLALRSDWKKYFRELFHWAVHLKTIGNGPPKGPFPRGLVNSGNTCYLNSVIQAVSSCPPFVDYVKKLADPQRSSSLEASFSKSLSDCIREIRPQSFNNMDRAYNAGNLLKNFVWDKENEQQDAEELLQYMISKLTEENYATAVDRDLLSKMSSKGFSGISSLQSDRRAEKEELKKSVLVNPFEGWIASHMECQDCHARRVCKHQLFTDIPLSLRAESSTSPMKKGGRVTNARGSTAAASMSLSSLSGVHPTQQQQLRQGEFDLIQCLKEFVQGEIVSDVMCPKCTADVTERILKEDLTKLEALHNIPAEIRRDIEEKKKALKIVKTSVTPGVHDSIAMDLEAVAKAALEDYDCLDDTFSDDEKPHFETEINSLNNMHINAASSLHNSGLDHRPTPVEDADLDDICDNDGWTMKSFSPESSGSYQEMPNMININIREMTSLGFSQHSLSSRSSHSGSLHSFSTRSHTSEQHHHIHHNQPLFEEYLIKHMKTTVRKTSYISRLPKLLCFHLNRRVYCPARDRMIKISGPVHFDFQLSMDSFFKPSGEEVSRATGTGSTRSKLSLERQHQYELRSVIEHKGSADSGHYRTFSIVDGEWMLFDDERVHRVNKDEVRRCEAYLLFYTLKEKIAESLTTTFGTKKR